MVDIYEGNASNTSNTSGCFRHKADNSFYTFFERLEKPGIYYVLIRLGYTRVADIASASWNDLQADAGCGIVIAKLLIREAIAAVN